MSTLFNIINSLTPPLFKRILYSLSMFFILILINSCKDETTNEEPQPLSPSIISFTPSSGSAGDTEVIITGSNFSSVATENKVKIGSITAVVNSASTTSITITVPVDAITAKIAVTCNGKTTMSAADFIVTEIPSNQPYDFFTLTVDQSFDMKGIEKWIMASSIEGDWIDIKPIETGTTIVLHGSVPDNNVFNLHFLTVAPQPNGTIQCVIKTTGGVPVKGKWILKTGTNTTTSVGVVQAKINNRLPNSILSTLSSNAGTRSISYVSTGNSLSIDAQMLRSPADILVTMYTNGYPKYAFYKNLNVNSTIILDESKDGLPSEKKFTVSLPPHDFYSASINAFMKGETYGLDMCSTSGFDEPNAKFGYNLGYDKYVTHITYFNGKKGVLIRSTGPTVKEDYLFPSYDIKTSKTAVSDFAFSSTFEYDVSLAGFSYSEASIMSISWGVTQPAKVGTLETTFKVKPFPEVLTSKYPYLPDVSKIQSVGIGGYQYFGTKSYPELFAEGAQLGLDYLDLYTDNFVVFNIQK